LTLILTQQQSEYTTNRVYVDQYGNRYPSSSTVAGKFWSTYSLYKWRIKLGQEKAEELKEENPDLILTEDDIKQLGKIEAEKIRDYSARRGTAIHEAIELGQSTGNPEWDLFVEQYYKHIDQHLEIKHQEIALGYTSDKTVLYGDKEIPCRTAGKADLIGLWKDKLVIGDFKTCDDKKPKGKSFMGRFALQMAIYSCCFDQQYGVEIDEGVIFNLMPSNVKVLRIPLAMAKQVLDDKVLPGFYEYYKIPENERPWANQFLGLGNYLDKFQRELAKEIIVEDSRI